MSGHSHAANVRKKKEANASKRMQLFEKLVRLILAAARAGGTDPETNAALAYALERAKTANMPRDTVERTLKRAAGGAEGELYEATFEAIGPGGVAILAECVTDSKNRTHAELRKLVERHGGRASHVAWGFERKGIFLVPSGQISEDDLLAAAADAGAEDVQAHGEGFDVVTPPAAFETVRRALSARGVRPEVAEIMTVPKSRIDVADAGLAHRLAELVELIDDHPDVQRVATNAHLPLAVGA